VTTPTATKIFCLSAGYGSGMTTTTRKKVTQAQAERVLAAIKKQFPYGDTDTAKIMWDWNTNGTPVICWGDGAPDDWWDNFDNAVKGVFCEAIVPCVLGMCRE